MPTTTLGTLLKLLGAVLIAQALLGAEAGVVSKREIAADASATAAAAAAARLNDPDIVMASGETKLEEVDNGQPKVEAEIESVTRKSTKLLPQMTNNNNNNNNNKWGNDLRASEEMVLNRMEAEAAKSENSKELNAAVKVQSEERTATTMKVTTEANVFSHNAPISTAGNASEKLTIDTSNIGGVNNALDELAAEQKSSERTTNAPNMAASTEELLPELERVALKPVTVRSNVALESVATTAAPLATTERSTVGMEQGKSQSNEHQLEVITKQQEAVTLGLEKSTTAAQGVNNAMRAVATTDSPLALPELIMSTTTTTATTTAKAAAPIESNSDLMPTVTPSIAIELSTIKHVASNEGESNEIRNSAGSAEKRGKFINDNSTNAQQMILPNAAEVWTLAGMKAVPHVNVSHFSGDVSKEQGNELLLDTTEQAPNNSAISHNSEKNLLDWTQIMMSGAVDGNRFEKLLDSSTTPRIEPVVTKHALEKVTLSDVEAHHKSFENHTELHVYAGDDTTDGAVERATKATATTAGVSAPAASSSTHLPPVVNEVGIDVSTEAAEREELLVTQKPLPVVTTEGVVPSIGVAATSSTAAPILSTTTVTTLDANNLSADNADKHTSVELLQTHRISTEATIAAMETTAATASGSKIESETVKSPQQVVTSTTAASLPTETPTPTPTTQPPLVLPASATTETSPPAGNNNEATLDVNHDSWSSGADTDRNVDSAAAVGTGSNTTMLEHSSSETSTLSTLATSEASTTSASAGHTISTSSEQRVASETTTDQPIVVKVTTTTTTALPAILVANTRPNTTTEVGQIGNEVELEVSTAASSSTSATIHSSDGDNEDGGTTATAIKAATTSSPVNELLITTTATTTTIAAAETTAATATATTTTTEKAISTTEKTATPIEAQFETSTVIPLQVATTTTTTTTTTATAADTKAAATTTTTKSPTLGSAVLENNTSTTATTIGTITTTTTTTTVAAPAAVTEDRKVNEVSNSASHETETSIETNAIDQLEKSTTQITTTTSTVAPSETNIKDITSEESETAPNVLGNNEHTLPTETTMATFVLNATAASPTINVTTTEPPLINLLDDTTTSTTTTTTSSSTTSTTTISSIATKIEEVYSVFSTTTSTTEPTIDSNHTTAATATVSTVTTPLTPLIDSSTTSVLGATMLPPPPTLHASIGSTNLPGMTSGNMHPNSTDGNETDVNVIIAITVSIIGVVALILLVAFLYLIRKRQKQMSYGQRCRPVSLDAYSLDNVSVLGSVRRKGALRASKRSYGNIAFDDPSLRHNVLTAAELAKFVERRSSIFEEFRDVPQIIARADEVPPGCEDKNRYANVIPLPETRVILQQQHDDEKTEYINANYVRGPKDAPNYYIATQAPLETTVADFWRMVWEQQSRVIIQATDLIENGIEKCAEYLPPSVTLDNHTTFGDFQITLKHREVKDKYAISTLLLKHIVENASRELTHYWYKWPETGVPTEEAPIIAMLLEARSSLKGYANELREKSSSSALKAEGTAESSANGNGVTVVSLEDSTTTKKDSGNGEINGNVSGDKLKATTTARNQGPLTIHCSPGTGRTGTIIACDMAIRSLETPKRSVDIPQIVYYVRRGRASAVQTKEQYEFIYKVAYMYATKITNLSNDN